jgi:ATP-dependent Clp protease ATP-binding subunit ClpA
VNLGELISGTHYRGDFEKKVSEIIKIAKEADILLFIDEFHNIKGMGKSE